jgi:hypothetical protein
MGKEGKGGSETGVASMPTRFSDTPKCLPAMYALRDLAARLAEQGYEKSYLGIRFESQCLILSKGSLRQVLSFTIMTRRV